MLCRFIDFIELFILLFCFVLFISMLAKRLARKTTHMISFVLKGFDIKFLTKIFVFQKCC